MKFLPIFFAVFLNCYTSHVIINKEYLNKSFDKTSLAIIEPKDVFIEYVGNVKPEFGEGDTKKLIYNYFLQRLPTDILKHTLLETAKFEKPKNIPMYKDTVVEVSTTKLNNDAWPEMFSSRDQDNEDEVIIKYPPDGFIYEFDNFEPDFVLNLNDLIISTNFTSNYSAPMMGANGMMMGGGSSTTKSLYYIAKFSIWDNKNGKRVAIGKVEGSTVAIFGLVTILTWESTSRSFVEKIFEDTPFFNSKVYTTSAYNFNEE